jgi:hypothetical protein
MEINMKQNENHKEFFKAFVLTPVQEMILDIAVTHNEF